jgi:chromosomal replication initiator protein
LPPDPHLEQTWTAVVEQLREEIPDDVFGVWLEPLRPVAISEDTLYVQAPRQTLEWIGRRFGAALSRALGSLDQSLRRVEIVGGAGQPPPPGADTPRRESRLNQSFRFDDFVIGAGNRFAHAAALATAELPGQAYNPLFLCGSPGVGKTHLLSAIGNYTVRNDSSIDVVYATGETFTGEFTGAVRAGRMEAFKARYRNADLLLLDDVQFIESKPRTAEELLHTFDALLGRGAQIVICADRSPGALPALDTRLRERFESGLVVEVESPDFETRLSIIRMRVGTWLADEEQLAALEPLARRVSSSIHALEGALVRVRAYASLTQQPLTSALVEHVLANLYQPPGPAEAHGSRPSIDQIQSSTSIVLELPIEELMSAKRGRRVVYARQVAMYLCRELTDLSLPAIGQRFGGRDHTTVLHAHRQMRKRLLTDSATRELVDEIRGRLRAGDQTR